MIQINKESLHLVEKISNLIQNQTFHHHYHILYDIASTYPIDYTISYVEIGCYAGGSACLMLQRKNTNVISIDLGVPINPNVVYQNISSLNIHNNEYNYIMGSSHDINTINKLSELMDMIDILFIDGDHSYSGVINDFNMYSKLVISGGYIIFDDYNDNVHSPQVKPAVDYITTTVSDEFEIIGTFKNIMKARPSNLIDGNCFVIRKI
jgi:predicted O-methyltransferase YrrM